MKAWCVIEHLSIYIVIEIIKNSDRMKNKKSPYGKTGFQILKANLSTIWNQDLGVGHELDRIAQRKHKKWK